MKITKLVPILVVDSIEDNLSLWVSRLGYSIETQVPHGEKIGFVILKQAESEIMMQSKASILDDLKVFAGADEIPPVILYGDVDSLGEIRPSSGDVQILIKDRTTFYGAKETWIRTREGHIVGFAEHKN